jgi:hypothetical protein
METTSKGLDTALIISGGSTTYKEDIIEKKILQHNLHKIAKRTLESNKELQSGPLSSLLGTCLRSRAATPPLGMLPLGVEQSLIAATKGEGLHKGTMTGKLNKI